MRATRTRAAPGWGWPSPVTLPARMAAISRSATVRWVACAPPCACRCSLKRGKEGGFTCSLRRERLQLFRVLEVELEAAGHDDIAGLLAELAVGEPFPLDPGGQVAQI